MSYVNGNICCFFENGDGSCFCNGSRCDNPFSNEGCKIQCQRVFKEEYDGIKDNRYKPEEQQEEERTKSDVFKELGIHKGDLVGDWFIPYFKLDSVFSPSDEITYGYEMVEKKFKDVEIYPQDVEYSIYQNVKVADVNGIYIIGYYHEQ